MLGVMVVRFRRKERRVEEASAGPSPPGLRRTVGPVGGGPPFDLAGTPLPVGRDVDTASTLIREYGFDLLPSHPLKVRGVLTRCLCLKGFIC